MSKKNAPTGISRNSLEKKQTDGGEKIATSKSNNIYRLLRIARDMKVTDLANELDVTREYIHAIEAGTRTPSSTLQTLYSHVLDVPEEVILTFSVDKSMQVSFEAALLKLLSIICGDGTSKNHK